MSDGGVLSYSTPYGNGLIRFDQGFMTSVTLPRPGRQTAAAAKGAAPRRVAAIRAGLEKYFRGERVTFAADDLPIDWGAWTPVQRDVARSLLEIPWGETASYSELAAASGHPGAQRAVGSFMAANPFPVVFPCHRVVRSDGRPGDYSAGSGWKERLLALEAAGGARPFPPRGA